MPDGLLAAFAAPGLVWLVLTIGIAGVVRGFAGFGTALIFVPVAGQFLPAADVILLMAITGVASLLTLAPTAWPVADKREVATLAGATVLTVPLGLWLLTQIDDLVIRWMVAVIASITLIAIITGWQWRGRLGTAGLGSVGGSAGIVGGMTGLTGPVVIMFYLANARSAAAVRANIILFLAALDAVIIANLLISGLVGTSMLWLGLVLIVPYLLATLVGQAFFDPAYEKTYRIVAYAVIALAVVSGLPILD